MTWRTPCAALLAITIVSSPATARTLGEYAEFSARRATTATKCLPAPLKAALARIRAVCGKVRVISTFRRNARVAGSGRRSLHASCRAVDFHAPRRCALKVLSGWPGGLGTYSGRMSHIHLDTGSQVRFSRGGGRPSVVSSRKRLARGGKAFSSQRALRTKRQGERLGGLQWPSQRRRNWENHPGTW